MAKKKTVTGRAISADKANRRARARGLKRLEAQLAKYRASGVDAPTIDNYRRAETKRLNFKHSKINRRISAAAEKALGAEQTARNVRIARSEAAFVLENMNKNAAKRIAAKAANGSGASVAGRLATVRDMLGKTKLDAEIHKGMSLIEARLARSAQIAKLAKLAGRVASKFAGPVGVALTAYDVGSSINTAYKDVKHMQTLDAAGQAKWHKDKRTIIAGGSLQQRYSALSPAQKAQFKSLDKAGRKAMLEGKAVPKGSQRKQAASKGSKLIDKGTGAALFLSDAEKARSSKAYLNKKAANKASAARAKKVVPGNGARKPAAAGKAAAGKNGVNGYTKKDGTTVQVTAAQAAAYRKRRK